MYYTFLKFSPLYEKSLNIKLKIKFFCENFLIFKKAWSPKLNHNRIHFLQLPVFLAWLKTIYKLKFKFVRNKIFFLLNTKIKQGKAKL